MSLNILNPPVNIISKQISNGISNNYIKINNIPVISQMTLFSSSGIQTENIDLQP